MADIVLFHSVLGLRSVERDAASLWRQHGHTVSLPDLFDGAATDNLEAGFANMDRIGWSTIVARGEAAASRFKSPMVLVGFSMGTGVIAELLPRYPSASAVLCFHGLASLPQSAGPNLAVQGHLAVSDPFTKEPERWLSSARQVRASVELFLYDGAGHYFTDPTLPDYDAEAATAAFARSLEFLGRL